jgi:diguanylate cyclase (GGDEF)-like protein/PAS domain S-box-containing protein
LLMDNHFNNVQNNLSRMLDDNFIVKTVMDHSSDSIYFKDTDGRFAYVNQIKAMHNGIHDPMEMIGKTDFDFFSKSDAEKIANQEKQIIETGKAIINLTEKLVRMDGQTSWASVSKSPIYDRNKEIVGIFGISRDITEAEKAKDDLVYNENKFRIMIENISEIIEIIDINGKVKYISPNSQKVMDWTYEEMINQSCFQFIHPDDQKMILIKFEEIVKRPGATSFVEFKAMNRDGSYKSLELCGVNLMENKYIEGILVNYHDISERKMQEDKIRFLSYHDVLTNLYNRSFYEEEKLRLDTDRQLPFSIIMGDVNGLKLTNDAYGHAEGDKLLIEVARILRMCCRKEDIIARVGGDEFCVLLPQTDSSAAQNICTRIYEVCGKHSNGSRIRKYRPSISLGHATKTEKDQSIDRVIKAAEDFMYRRKLLERDTTHSSIINSIQATMHEHTNETEEHSDRMIKLSLNLGKVLGLADEQLLELDLLSRLHDIGKICIDDNILSKPGKLTDDEWTKVKQHPEVGFRIAQASAELIRISHLILSHHERWDGTGYPQGLSGHDIPFLSRIVSIIDAYDAMTQDRPYRKALSKETAINEIINNANKQFDPQIARIFVEQVLEESWEEKPQSD